jgi:hypothetical protein
MHPRHLLTVVLLVAGGLARAADLNVITAVGVKDEGAAVVLTIQGSRAPNFTTFSMADPPRFVIDLSETKFQGVQEDIIPSDGLVKLVKNLSYGSDATSIARVMLAFTVDVDPPDVSTRGTALVVRVARPAGAAMPVADAKATKAKEEADQKAAEAARAEAAKQEAQAKADAEKRAKHEAARAEESRKAQEDAARAEAEKAAQARAASEQRAKEESARAEAGKKGGEDAARAAAEQKANEQEELRKAREAYEQERQAAVQKEQAEAEAKAREETEAKARAEAEAKAQAKSRPEPVRASRKTAEPVAEPAAVAAAEPAPAPEPEPEPAAEPAPTAAEPVATAARATLREVGFRQTAGGSRIFVRTSPPPRFTIQDVGENTIRVTLENTRATRGNDLRFLDTSFFPSAIALVTPKRVGSSYVLDVRMRERVPYQQRIEGDTLAIDFERPSAAAAPGATAGVATGADGNLAIPAAADGAPASAPATLQ